jgi:manganese/iron transport system permease protein
VVPAATARLLSHRLVVITGIAAGVGMLGGWLGLAASYEASVNHGVRLASAATVVLALVALYLFALAVGPVIRLLRRNAPGARRPAADAVAAVAEVADVADAADVPASAGWPAPAAGPRAEAGGR